jgi:GAF domain-containing protein
MYTDSPHISLRFEREGVMWLESHEALLQAVAVAAAAIFATAATEAEVCELEQAIYEEIDRIAAVKIAELS